MITHQPVNDHDDMHKVTDNMLREIGLSIDDCGGKVTFAGAEPVRKTTMKAGACPAIILAANAVAEAAIWKERSGEGQDIHVDLRKAWIEQSPWQMDAAPYTLVNGAHKMFNFGVYVVLNPQCPTRDGRWMIMCPLYPSQERKILRLLNCGPDEEQLRAAIIKRDALEMEAAAEAMQVPFQMIRTREEWEASEQGQINAQTPLISIEKIGESEPIPLPNGERPLSGLRVLSMVHAVAGPCCPRTLAGQGADCLNLNMPDWIEYGNFFYQADVGLRQAYLDARKAEKRKAEKHFGKLDRIELSGVALLVHNSPDEILTLNDMLVVLSKEEPEGSELVKLRIFADFSVGEAGKLLGMSRPTAYRHWTYARAWLKNAMADEETRDGSNKN